MMGQISFESMLDVFQRLFLQKGLEKLPQERALLFFFLSDYGQPVTRTSIQYSPQNESIILAVQYLRRVARALLLRLLGSLLQLNLESSLFETY